MQSEDDVELNKSREKGEQSTDEKTIKNQLDLLNGVSQRLLSFGNFKQSVITEEYVSAQTDTAASTSNHASTQKYIAVSFLSLFIALD